VCGAWMKRPPPTYMPTCPIPSKKTRSPGRSDPRGTPPAELEVRVGAVRELDPEMPVDEADEAGAVEAASRRVAAVAVRDAEQVPGVAGGPLPERLGPLRPRNVGTVEAQPGRLQLGGEAALLPAEACPVPRTAEYAIASTSTSRRRRIREVISGVPSTSTGSERRAGVVGPTHSTSRDSRRNAPIGGSVAAQMS
jgi:hypothetical protein